MLQRLGASYQWNLCVCKWKLLPDPGATPGWGCPWPVVSLWKTSGVSVSMSGMSGFFNLHLWEENNAGPKTSYWGGQVWVDEGISASGWNKNWGYSLCSRSQLLGKRVPVSSQTRWTVECVCECILAGKPQPGLADEQWGLGLMLQSFFVFRPKMFILQFLFWTHHKIVLIL